MPLVWWGDVGGGLCTAHPRGCLKPEVEALHPLLWQQQPALTMCPLLRAAKGAAVGAWDLWTPPAALPLVWQR